MTLAIGSLFSGVGGLELGVARALARRGVASRIVWQAENDPAARRVLAHHWPEVHRYNDVRSIDHEAPPVDLICGGFPCQDISLAGAGAGIDGPKSGLWSEYARIVRVLRPSIVFVENVAALAVRGLDRVLGDLAALGFDAEWDVLRAADVGAPHRRERLFILAYADRERVRQLAERDQRGGRGAREAERGDAEPVDPREKLADADGTLGRREARDAITGTGAAPVRFGTEEPRRRSGSVADAAGGGRWQGREQVRGRESDAAGGGAPEDGMANPASPGCEGALEREPPGPRRTEPAEPGERDVAHAYGSRRADTEDPGASRGDEGARAEAEGRRISGGLELERDGRSSLAHAHSDGRQLFGRSEQERGEAGQQDACGDESLPTPRSHRFPPGPSAIAGWDGPQPAIRRSDDGVPGRSHRLRLLGNAVVPQQAALAFEVLAARAAGNATGERAA